MSMRNRPRGAIVVKEELADELNLWNTIVEKIKKCSSIDEKYGELAAKISQVEDGLIEGDEANYSLDALSLLEENHRLCLKYSEHLLRILNEEPDDLIKNLETLISVRAAFEIDSSPPPSGGAAGSGSTPQPPEKGSQTGASGTAGTAASSRSASVSGPTGASTKPSRSKRKFESDGHGPGDAATPEPAVIINVSGTGNATSNSVPNSGSVGRLGKNSSRSGSVAAASVKSETSGEATENVKTVASERQAQGKFAVGSEVFFRNKDKRAEGEGILCRITSIIGEGKHRRYEVQDTELDDRGHEVPPWRAQITSLTAVPSSGSSLPALPKGKQVLALYPQTNTWYKAETLGMRRDMCRVRFEGEDDPDTEKEVERRFVLEYK